MSFEYNPFETPLRFGPVVTPDRAADGTDLDRAAAGFLGTFPMAEQTDDGILLNPPTLKGIWDRAPGFLHDGRAANLREVVSTPGHPALREGETGYNERDGIPDTHGGTSHLTAGEVRDLVRFMKSL